jgi:iron complex transport system substrate-binding protein
MKTKILLLTVLFTIFSCKKSENQEQKKWQKISERIQYLDSGSNLELKSGKNQYKIPKTKLPFRKIVLLNASLVGYITELKQENAIIGLSSPEYIFSEKVLDLIQKNKISIVGDEAKYDIEKIIALQPDVIFTNYIESFQNTYDILKKNGIEIIFIDEYMEQNPLEKSKILEVFGELLGCKKSATETYNLIQNKYNTLSEKANNVGEKPFVIANEMYGNQWYMPGGKTFVAKLIKDAGAKYILAENKEIKAVPMSFEEVFAKAENAKFWVNIGNYNNKAALLTMNANYSKMAVFQHGELYAITQKQRNRANDYFESGVVRADKILEDYISIFHPEIMKKQSLNYMKKLD